MTRSAVAVARPGQDVSAPLDVTHTGSAPVDDPWTVQRRTKAAGLPGGTSTASIAAVDPSAHLAPTALANTSRLPDGSSRRGRVGVALSGPTTSRRG